MSKFADKLRSLSESSTTSIGFHPSAPELKSPAMLLVVGLSGSQVKGTEIVANVNADAWLMLGQGLSARIVRQIARVAGDNPVGVFAKSISEGEIDEFVGLGCDFVVFDIKAAAAILHKEGVGKILMIEPSLDPGYVRAINSTEVDGVLINSGDEDNFVAIEHLLVCRRFVELLEKPLLMTLPSSVTKVELTNLWQAGIDGVVISSIESVETLVDLKKRIGDLPRGNRSRQAKLDVMLPHYGGFVATEEDEDEE